MIVGVISRLIGKVFGKKRTEFKDDFDKARYTLGIDNEFISIEDTKQIYYKNRRKPKRFSMVEINWAYEYLMNNIEIDLYDKSNIEVYKDDFYDRISRIYLNKCRGVNSFDSSRDLIKYYKSVSISDKYVEKRVRYLTSVLSYRMKEDKKPEERSESGKKDKVVVKEVPKEKVYKYSCTECNKNYMTSRTFEMHLNSKKHLEKSGIKEAIGIKTEEAKPVKKQLSVTSKRANLQKSESKKTESHSSLQTYQTEHSLFLTCSKCKKSFKSRLELIKHVQECMNK
ncbi:hypothetical protein ECANGB1_469 [Enterospora canceri]|uniref:C2H2-type domain-containing protein n=1 Tax=Enterospora canceri TaxID=1081671 RepID=A0A1Y1S8Q6_9MICR|nr:hypothetical protein ECANGB1_469 [Enterospora canceri]